MPELRDEALRIWQAGLSAADPRAATARALASRPPSPRTTVIAIGKAGVAMAQGARDAWGPSIGAGLVLVPHGAASPVDGLEVLEAAHPVPDAAGLAAARRIEELVDGLTDDDALLALISGGGSALLADPAPPLDLEGLQERTRAFLRSGEPIEAVNRWRIAHGTLKGGRMGQRARPARVLTLVLSDVPGRPELVASGPTAGTGDLVEIGGLEPSVRAAVDAARAAGWPVRRLPPLEGEASDRGRAIAADLRAAEGPLALITGGECTVTVRGTGTGGRCQELALAAALELAGHPGVALVAAGTDGRDGPTDAAGALVTGDTVQDARSATDALAHNDSHPFLDRAGALVRTGPTGTNVGDLLVALRRP